MAVQRSQREVEVVIELPRVKKQRPETTPTMGATPTLPDEEVLDLADRVRAALSVAR